MSKKVVAAQQLLTLKALHIDPDILIIYPEIVRLEELTEDIIHKGENPRVENPTLVFPT